MKRILILTASCLALSTASALGADLPNRKEAPIYAPAPPIFTWTGFYVGAYAGGAFRDIKGSIPGSSFSASVSPSGVTAGGLIGYNYQMGQVVLGLEGDFGYNDLNQDINVAPGFSARLESSYIGRVRGRLGYSLGSALLYAAGGVSFTDEKASVFAVPGGLIQGVSNSLTGFNVGAGVEYAFTPNWIGRLEYIYDDFGSQNYAFSAFAINAKVKTSQSTVRAAIEYKF